VEASVGLNWGDIEEVKVDKDCRVMEWPEVVREYATNYNYGKQLLGI
jgi:hypothetical protein